MTQHSKKAAAFLKDAKYSQWHDATFWAVRSKRDTMAQGLPEWERLREKASAIKRHTLSHLDEYLEQFAAQAEKNARDRIIINALEEDVGNGDVTTMSVIPEGTEAEGCGKRQACGRS